MSWLGDVGGFAEGVGEGAWDGVKGMVEGVGHLAQSGYKLATNSQYRKQAWDDAVHDAKAVGNFAATAVTDPGKAATETGHAISGAWHSVQTAYDQAAAHGQGSAFVGKLFGQGAVMIGTAFVPGGAEADVAGALGDAGRVAELTGDAGKLADVTGDAGKLADTAGDAGKLTTHAEGQIEPPKMPEAEPVRPVKTFTSFNDFEEAANHPAPNTTYKYGDYQWSTDNEGRTIEASGTVKVREFGRNNPDLQKDIGHEGKSTDVGFHLIADSMDGPTVRLNVVPGNGKPIGDGIPNLNQGAYKRFENTVRDLASNPSNKVEVSVEPRYSAGNTTNRPDQFIASYRVNGGKWNTRKLINK